MAIGNKVTEAAKQDQFSDGDKSPKMGDGTDKNGTAVGQQNHADDETEIRDNEMCGFEIGCGRYKTKRFTTTLFGCCNNAKGALCFLSIAIFIQGMVVNGLVSIVVSTLEKRFHLRSFETGFIASSYDIGACIGIPVITYIGGRGHRPLWLGWGVLIMGLGSVVFSLPHFIAPAYSVSDLQSAGCGTNITDDCGDSSLRVYRGFFILGQILHGIGATPLFTLAVTYLDANVKQSKSSIYHGILHCFSVIGPGVGFLLGGNFLRLYINVGESVSLDQISPLWVGNWWIGFLLAGALAAVIAVPILMYPRQLPGTDKFRLDRESEMNQNVDAVKIKGDMNFGKSIKDVPKSVLVIVKNLPIVFISIAGAMDSGIVIAIATFGPKYVEAMYRLPASDAALFFGAVSIVTAGSGQVIGGVLVSKFKMDVPKMIKLCALCSVLALGCFLVFLIKCEDPEVAGVNVPHTNEATFSCETECGCSTNLYNPVCGADGLTYLSYCEAGCIQDQDLNYANCTRVMKSLQNATASSGKCEVESCPSVGYFLAIGGLAVFFTFLKAQPALQASLRSVPFEQRSFAMGIQWLFIRLLGLIPIPIIFGSVLDLSCLVWGLECGECGSCKLYNNYSMSTYITVLCSAAKFISVVFLLLALKTYHPPPKRDAEVTLGGYASAPPNGEVTQQDGSNPVHSEQLLPTEPGAFENAAFTN